MGKVVISVAPVDGSSKVLEPQKVAEDIIECALAGAGILHLHVRDYRGRLTADLAAFHEIIRRVKEQVDIIVQVSPGGISPVPMKERCIPLYEPEVEMTSLNMTSMNFGKVVRIIRPEDVECLLGESVKAGVKAEVEVFDPGDFYTYEMYRSEFSLGTPGVFNIGLGHPGRLPAERRSLDAFLPFIPEGALWGFTQIGRKDFTMVRQALQMGAFSIRVGMEDSPWLSEEKKAERNVELVRETARQIRELGAEPAAPEEIRRRLGIKS